MRVSIMGCGLPKLYYAPVACHIIRKNTQVYLRSYSKHKQKKTVQHHEQENSKLMIISANTK